MGLTRRHVLAGAAVAGGVMLPSKLANAEANDHPYAWFQHHTFTVFPRTWTAVHWTIEWENNLGLNIEPDGRIIPPAAQLFDMDVEIAWENVHGIPAHRRMVRHRDALYGLPWVRSDIASAPTNGTPDDQIPQAQLCNMQPNAVPFYIEVWHNAVHPINCVHYITEAPSLMMVQLTST